MIHSDHLERVGGFVEEGYHSRRFKGPHHPRVPQPKAPAGGHAPGHSSRLRAFALKNVLPSSNQSDRPFQPRKHHRRSISTCLMVCQPFSIPRIAERILAFAERPGIRKEETIAAETSCKISARFR